MAYSYSKKAQNKIVDFMDKLTVSAPFARESNKKFEGEASKAPRGGSVSILVDPPDVGSVTVGSAISDETTLSIVRPHQVTVTMTQKHTECAINAVNQELDFTDDDSVLGLRAQNLGSTIHAEVCDYLSYGLTATVATAGKEMTALASATSAIRAHRGAEIIGGFSSQAMPALYADSIKTFLPDDISKATYQESSIGRFAMANWFETQDISLYTWTQGLNDPTATASITFDADGMATQVVIAKAGLTGTVLAGTPMKIAGLKTCDVLGKATGYDAVVYAKTTATAAGASVTVDLAQPIFRAGNRKNVTATGNITGAAVTYPLTTAKTYARAITYAKATNLFRQMAMPKIMNTITASVGDGVQDLRLQMTTDGNFRQYQNEMRIDGLTGGNMGYSQWAHTVFFQLD